MGGRNRYQIFPVPYAYAGVGVGVAGILGGLPVEGGVLWCCTEKISKSELDRTVVLVKEVLTA